MKSKAIIFDLDDTLYNEIDYLLSAYREIAEFLSTFLNEKVGKDDIYELMCTYYKDKKNIFQEILNYLEIPNTFTPDQLLNIYRNHRPTIKINSEGEILLDYLVSNNYNLGLITDGRSVQQRNKIKSLGLEKYFKIIVISEEFGSEKPSLKNFRFFEEMFAGCAYYYIADNPKKDFIGPNELGWTTICLVDNGRNIHPQNFAVEAEYLPNYSITKLSQILEIIQ
jgi:putative hydrolase of the HAD superfamily